MTVPLRSLTPFLLAGTLLLAGCGDDDDLTAPPQTGLVEVELRADSFSPATVTIEPGTTVRWTNQGAVEHTVTPDGHEEWERVVLTLANETFEHTFETVGDFEFFCEPHQALGMVGEIRVREP